MLLKLLFALKIAIFCCFCLVENLDFNLKKFYNISNWSSFQATFSKFLLYRFGTMAVGARATARTATTRG